MANNYFQFKQFTIYQQNCAMKVTTDGCVFGAWCAAKIGEILSDDRPKTGEISLLDIGTGTGLLSLMVAQKNEIKIDAIEIEPNAFLQAKENFLSSPWSNNLKGINEDINIFTNQRLYDFIISNPPFYEQELSSGKFEKDLALHSKLLTFRNLIKSIKNNLHQNGIFFLLLPFKRLAEVEKIISEQGFFIRTKVFLHQSEKHGPFRVMLMGTQHSHQGMTESIVIKSSEGSYTDKFIELLKAYYLKL